jgi:hypothetical protein
MTGASSQVLSLDTAVKLKTIVYLILYILIFSLLD